MAGGDHVALVLVSHQDIAIGGRWRMCCAVFTRSKRNRPWRCWPAMLLILEPLCVVKPAAAGRRVASRRW